MNLRDELDEIQRLLEQHGGDELVLAAEAISSIVGDRTPFARLTQALDAAAASVVSDEVDRDLADFINTQEDPDA